MRRAKYLLSIDGGGIRAILVESFLRKLEKELGIEVSAIFDAYAGTSCGSISVASMVVLAKSPAEMIRNLYNYKDKIFNKTFLDSLLGNFQWKPKYSASGLAQAVQENFGARKMSDSPKLLLISSYDITTRETVVFSSQHSQADELIADVIHASCSAPTYFPAFQMTKGAKKSHYFIDGGVCLNSPAMSLFCEARRKWPDDEIYLLSIGTGSFEEPIDGKSAQKWGFQWVFHGLIDIFRDQDHVCSQAKVILGDNFLRIQGKICQTCTLDNTSAENCLYLEKRGEDLFYEFEDELRKFFKDFIKH
eukprot:Sdes_comp20443_c0_seq1m14622